VINNDSAEPSKSLKVKLPWKVVAFVAATISLSLWFESWRQVSRVQSLAHIMFFLAATLLTLLLVWLQAFWIYLEEKSKGTLTRRVAYFDQLESGWLKSVESHGKNKILGESSKSV
jgi:hypothetical protein